MALISTVVCQTGEDLLHQETRSSGGSGEKEFTTPEAPKGEKVAADPVIKSAKTLTSATPVSASADDNLYAETKAPAGETEKSFTSAEEPVYGGESADKTKD